MTVSDIVLYSTVNAGRRWTAYIQPVGTTNADGDLVEELTGTLDSSGEAIIPLTRNIECTPEHSYWVLQIHADPPISHVISVSSQGGMAEWYRIPLELSPSNSFFFDEFDPTFYRGNEARS